MVWKRILKQLSSLPLAIAQLAIIAALSAVGTVVEQNRPLEFYTSSYPEGTSLLGHIFSYHGLLFLQWDHIYTANYFLGLMALLAASLAACSATSQWPQVSCCPATRPCAVWRRLFFWRKCSRASSSLFLLASAQVKVAQRWRFVRDSSRLSAMENAEVLPSAQLSDLGALLKAKHYQVFMADGALYAFRGLAGKLGPIGVHASMLAVMAGVALGGLGGFKGDAMIPQGTDFAVGAALSPASGLAWQPAGTCGSRLPLRCQVLPDLYCVQGLASTATRTAPQVRTLCST